jgi:hypothetical protein
MQLPVATYLRLLFTGWLSALSSGLTLASLVGSLLPQGFVPQLYESVPREYFFLFAFLSFAVANFLLFRVQLASFHWSQRRTPQANLPREPFRFLGGSMIFDEVLQYECSDELHLENTGPTKFIGVSVEGVSAPGLPRRAVSRVGESVRVWLADRAEWKESQSSLRLRQDESLDILVVVSVALDRKDIERNLGGLINLKELRVIWAVKVGSKVLVRRSLRLSVEETHAGMRNMALHRIEGRSMQADGFDVLRARSEVERVWLGEPRE